MSASDSVLRPAVGNDSAMPVDLNGIYSDFLEDDIMRKPFRSSLLGKESKVELVLESPDDNFIANIITNPESITECGTPMQALYKVVFPLLAGCETKRHKHQVIHHFLKDLRIKREKYRKSRAVQIGTDERHLEEAMEMVREKHFVEHFARLVEITSVEEFVRQKRWFQGQRDPIAPVTDAKSAYLSVMRGVLSGDITPFLATLLFVSKNRKASFSSHRFSGTEEWLRHISFEGLAFIPTVNKRTRMIEVMKRATENASIATNGRYLYISREKGEITRLLLGQVIESVAVGNKQVVCACSNGMLYVTDFEKEYVYRDFPLMKLDERPKMRLTWPFCSDGNFIYSLAKPMKKINVTFIESPKSLKTVRVIELSSACKNGMYIKDFDERSSMMYCNGSIVTLMQVTPIENDMFRYRVRHYSVHNGQHIGDFQFQARVPVSSVVYDAFNSCYYGLAVFKHSTRLMEFPHFGGLPCWVSGFDFGTIRSASWIGAKFDGAKSGKDVEIAVCELLKYYGAHAACFSMEQLTVNERYTTTFGNFISPLSDQVFSLCLDVLEEGFSQKWDSSILMAVLALLRLNGVCLKFKGNGELPEAERIMNILERAASDNGALTNCAVFTAMSLGRTLFKGREKRGMAIGDRAMHVSSGPCKLWLVKELSRKGLLMDSISDELCVDMLSVIFDKFVRAEPVLVVEVELVNSFQCDLMQSVTAALRSQNSVKVRDVMKTYELYTKLIFGKLAEALKVSGDLPRAFWLLTQRFVLMLRSTITYSRLARNVIPYLTGIFGAMTPGSSAKAMDCEGSLTAEYTGFLCIFDIYTVCIEAILTGGKELKKARKLLCLRSERNVVTAEIVQKVNEVFCSRCDVVITKELLNETQSIPAKYIDWVMSAISVDPEREDIVQKFTKLFEAVQKKFDERLARNLTPLEKAIERTIFVVFLKQRNCFEDFERFVEHGEITDNIKKIVKDVAARRRSFKESTQHSKNSEEFENNFLKKAQFLLLVGIPEKFSRQMDGILLSELSLEEVIFVIGEADQACSIAIDGYEHIAKLSVVDWAGAVLITDHLIAVEFWNRFCPAVKKEHFDSGFISVFHDLFTKSNSMLLICAVLLIESEILDYFPMIIRSLKEQQLYRSITLVVAVLYAKQCEHGGNSWDLRAIEEALFDTERTLTFRDVPMLRLAFRSRMRVPLEFSDLYSMLKDSTEVYMSSIVELLSDMIEQSDDQMTAFQWILEQIGIIAIGEGGFFADRADGVQLSICANLVELLRGFVKKEPLHSIFTEVLLKDFTDVTVEGIRDMKVLYAVFATLSRSFDTLRSHEIIVGENMENYITEIDPVDGSIKFYSLPFDGHACCQKSVDGRESVPISKAKLSLADIFPEFDVLIPHFANALKITNVDMIDYYKLQSLRVFCDSSAFLASFLESQPALAIEKVLFVDFSQYFLKMLRFRLKNPVFDAGNNFYTLKDSEDMTMREHGAETKDGLHSMYSPIMSDSGKIRILIRDATGDMWIGVQSLSMFHYAASACRCEVRTRKIIHNTVPIGALEQDLTTVSYDPATRELMFNDAFSIILEDEPWCFAITMVGKTRVDFEVQGEFVAMSEFTLSMPFQTLAPDSGGDLFMYPEIVYQDPASFSGKCVLDRPPIEFPELQKKQAANAGVCDILTPLTNDRMSSELERFCVRQVLGAMRSRINTRILVKVLETAPTLQYMLDGFDLSRVQLVDFAIVLLTLIEPLDFQSKIVNFSESSLTKRIGLEFDCIMRVIRFFKPAEVVELWSTILKNKMNTVGFHFIDLNNPDVIVLPRESIIDERTVVLEQASGFVVFKGGFSQHMPQIATINGNIPLRCNIVHVSGGRLVIKGCPDAPAENCVIIVPLYSEPNTLLFDSWLELAVAFKYFVLFIKEHIDSISSDTLSYHKIELYKFFMHCVNFENPFFVSYAEGILEFLKEHLPLSTVDMNESFGDCLKLFNVYSGDLQWADDFLANMQTLWDDKPFELLRAYFPEFHGDEVLDTDNLEFILPSSLFPKELITGTDYSGLVRVLKAVLLHDKIYEFPFYYIMDLWAQMASKYPSFTFECVDSRTLRISFTRFAPSNFGFLCADDITFTALGNGVFETSKDITKNLRFLVVNNDEPDLKDFLYENRAQFAEDIVLFIEHWNSDDDWRILRCFPEASLKVDRLSLELDPKLYLGSKIVTCYYKSAIRTKVIVAVNWLFVHGLLNITSRQEVHVFDVVSRGIRVSLFTTEVKEKSTGDPTILTVNRRAAMEVRRRSLAKFDNSLIAQISRQVKDLSMLRSALLTVQFEDEEGRDEGGPGRDLITEAAKDVVSETTGLFCRFGQEEWMLPAPSPQLNNRELMYRTVGALMGIIIRREVAQDFPFPNFVWNYMVTGKMSVKDIYDMDSAYHEQMEALKHVDRETFDELFPDLTFAEKNFMGCICPMKPGRVTYEKVQEFVAMSNRFKISLLKPHLENVRQGLLENLGVRELPLYVTPGLLQFCVCHFPDLPAKHLLRAVKFGKCVSDELRDMFIRYVNESTNDGRIKLLKFVTGRVRLQSTAGNVVFSVGMQWGTIDKLPRASVCSSELYLSAKYTSYEKAELMIRLAVDNAVEIAVL